MYGLAGVPLPFYNSTTLRLSLGLSPRVWSTVRRFLCKRSLGRARSGHCYGPWLTRLRNLPSSLRPHQLSEWKPDIVHVACPGMLVFAAQLYAYALSVPLVRIGPRASGLV